MQKNKIFPSLIVLGCVVALTSCVHETQAASEQPAVPVQLRTPAVVERAESVSASGSVEGSETADVAFQVGGRVTRVLVEEGQHVSKGQLLAEIEPTDYRNAFNAATAQKEAAQAVQQRADAGVRQQELEQARIDFERSEDEYKRMKFLLDRKSLPPNDFQKFEAAYKASRERYEMAKEGTRKEDIATAHAQAHAAEAQASEEGKRLSDTRLVAPISGNISMRRVDPGQTVAAGTAVFSIVDLNPVKGPRGSSRSRNCKSEVRRPRRGFRAVALGRPVRRESRNHWSCGRAGVAHVHGKDHRAQPRPRAAGGHGGGSPHLRPGHGSCVDASC